MQGGGYIKMRQKLLSETKSSGGKKNIHMPAKQMATFMQDVVDGLC